MQRALVCIKAENCIISYNVFKVQIIGQAMIYNRSIEGSGSLPQYKAEVTTMLKDMDFGVYGKVLSVVWCILSVALTVRSRHCQNHLN